MKVESLKNAEYLGDDVTVGIDEHNCVVLVKEYPEKTIFIRLDSEVLSNFLAYIHDGKELYKLDETRI